MLGKIVKENDFIICLAISHDNQPDIECYKQIMIQNNQIKLDSDKDKKVGSGDFKYPPITSLSWCAYKIRNNKVTNEETISIQNSNEKGHSFSDAIKRFTDFVFREIIMQNCAFKIIVEGDWVLQSQIQREAEDKDVRLGPHFQQYMNVFELFWHFKDGKTDETFDKLSHSAQIIESLGLPKQDLDSSKSMDQCQTLVRIVNRII